MTASSSKSASSTNSFLFEWCFLGVAAYAVGMIAYWAWKIRMQAIEEYGAVIHEFDPWFNYRATEVSYYCSVGEVIFICIRHFSCFAHLSL
jgi:dolichyl-diphosphooligosaccharide--protein glycosyltransferase